MKDSVEAIRTEEIPVWEKATLPENADVIMIAKQFVEKYGCKMEAWYRLPLTRVANITPYSSASASINGNGFAQVVPSNKVVPAYINISSPHDIRVASASNPATFAKFLVLGNDLNNAGYYNVQANGVYEFPQGHSYIVAQTYYLGEDGYPTTAKSEDETKVQKLFYVLDEKTIAIEL